MKFGNFDISDLKIGSTDINEVRIGSTLVWTRSTPSYTSDFIAATGISNATIIAALTALESDLTTAGLIDYSTPANNVIKAMYPIVGGSAATHKYNFLNPADTNAAYRLSFSGTWNHTSTGMLPNGTDAFANTFFIPNVEFAINNMHLSYYSRTDNTTGKVEMGATKGAFTEVFIVIRFSDGNKYRALNRITYVGGGSISRTDGYMIASRQDSATEDYYFRNALLSNETINIYGAHDIDVPIFIGAYNQNGTPILFNNRECAFATMGDALDATQAIDLSNAVQSFQTILGRQV